MVRSVYPVLMTEKLKESCEFYKTYFSFTETFSTDWYVSLRHPDGSELALIDARHETIPAPCRTVVNGMILNIEVDDATEIYKDLCKKNKTIILMPIQDEDYGQRHFMVQDPNQIVIDVIEEIAPGKEFQDSYVNGESS